MATPLEKGYVRRICKLLDARGAWWIKTTGQSSKVGCPDILACYMGTFLGIEVKPPKGRPSDAQRVQLERIRQAEGYAILAIGEDGIDSVNLALDFIAEHHADLVA